jgi:hypothetical protein
VLSLSRWVFSDQDGIRQKLKIFLEPSSNKLSEYVLQNLYLVCSPNGNGKRPSTEFLENDEIVLHLAAMSQCEQGGEVRYGTQLMLLR